MAEGVDLQRMRRSVAFERLLCRLFASGEEEWILKGGYAMELRIQSARMTKDIDLSLPASALKSDLEIDEQDDVGREGIVPTTQRMPFSSPSPTHVECPSPCRTCVLVRSRVMY